MSQTKEGIKKVSMSTCIDTSLSPSLIFDSTDESFLFKLETTNNSAKNIKECLDFFIHNCLILRKFKSHQRKFFIEPIIRNRQLYFNYYPGPVIDNVFFNKSDGADGDSDSFSLKEDRDYYIYEWSISVAIAMYIWQQPHLKKYNREDRKSLNLTKTNFSNLYSKDNDPIEHNAHIEEVIHNDNNYINFVTDRTVYIDSDLHARLSIFQAHQEIDREASKFFYPLYFMAPELSRSAHNMYDHLSNDNNKETESKETINRIKSDIYSFGIFLNTLIEGKTPDKEPFTSRTNKTDMISRKGDFEDKYPKREKSHSHELGQIVTDCIPIDAKKRIDTSFLLQMLIEKAKSSKYWGKLSKYFCDTLELDQITYEKVIEKLNEENTDINGACSPYFNYECCKINDLEKAYNLGLKSAEAPIKDTLKDIFHINNEVYSLIENIHNNSNLSFFELFKDFYKVKNIKEANEVYSRLFFIKVKSLDLSLFYKDMSDLPFHFEAQLDYTKKCLAFVLPFEFSSTISNILHKKFYKNDKIVKPIDGKKIPFFPFLNLYNFFRSDYQNDCSSNLSFNTHKMDLEKKIIVLLNIAEAIDDIHKNHYCLLNISSKIVYLQSDFQAQLFISSLKKCKEGRIDVSDLNNNVKNHYIYYRAPELLDLIEDSCSDCNNGNCTDLKKCDSYSFGILLNELINSVDPSFYVKNMTEDAEKLTYIKNFSKNSGILFKKQKYNLSAEYKRDQINDIINNLEDIYIKCTKRNQNDRINFETITNDLKKLLSQLSDTNDKKNSFNTSEKKKREINFFETFKDLFEAERNGSPIPQQIFTEISKKFIEIDSVQYLNYLSNFDSKRLSHEEKYSQIVEYFFANVLNNVKQNIKNNNRIIENIQDCDYFRYKDKAKTDKFQKNNFISRPQIFVDNSKSHRNWQKTVRDQNINRSIKKSLIVSDLSIVRLSDFLKIYLINTDEKYPHEYTIKIKNKTGHPFSHKINEGKITTILDQNKKLYVSYIKTLHGDITVTTKQKQQT